MDGIQPQAVDAEPGQVVKSASEPGEITDAVAVGVLERLDVQAVDDCLLVPPLGHVPSLSQAAVTKRQATPGRISGVRRTRYGDRMRTYVKRRDEMTDAISAAEHADRRARLSEHVRTLGAAGYVG